MAMLALPAAPATPQSAAPATPPLARRRAVKKRPASSLSPKEAAGIEMDHVVDPLDALVFGGSEEEDYLPEDAEEEDGGNEGDDMDEDQEDQGGDGGAHGEAEVKEEEEDEDKEEDEAPASTSKKGKKGKKARKAKKTKKAKKEEQQEEEVNDDSTKKRRSRRKVKKAKTVKKTEPEPKAKAKAKGKAKAEPKAQPKPKSLLRDKVKSMKIKELWDTPPEAVQKGINAMGRDERTEWTNKAVVRAGRKLFLDQTMVTEVLNRTKELKNKFSNKGLIIEEATVSCEGREGLLTALKEGRVLRQEVGGMECSSFLR